MLKVQIDKDLKEALLSGNKLQVNTLRGLKSAILYAEVADGKREKGLDEQAITQVIAKEAKKRQESADLYKQGGNQDKANDELTEKSFLEKYLPKQLSESEVSAAVDEYINHSPTTLTLKDMGKTIAAVKEQVGAGADGALIARFVKERLT